MHNIFEFTDYKLYLKDHIARLPARGHGFRSRMAASLGCHVAYVSQVLNKDAHFSLEQAEDLNGLLNHSEKEAKFFLLLVQKSRAGSKRLAERFEKELEANVKARRKLKHRVDITRSLSPLDQMKYYSSWRYAAAHMGVTLAALQTREKLAQHLKIRPEELDPIIEFLIEVGLVKLAGRRLLPGATRIFLNSESPMINSHHSNWRGRAVDSLDRTNLDAVHFSGVFTLGQSDVKALREEVLKAIDRARKLVTDSRNEERMLCFNVDLFDV